MLMSAVDRVLALLLLLALLGWLRHWRVLLQERQHSLGELRVWQERAARVPELQECVQAQALELQEKSRQLMTMAQQMARQEAYASATQEQYQRLRESYQQLQNQQTRVQTDYQALQAQWLRLQVESQHHEEKLAWVDKAREELSLQFQQLARQVLDEKSERVQEAQQTQLQQLLDPLKERLTEFRSKVEEIHRHDTEQQARLRAELVQLMELNRHISEEAHGLATALKGQSKTQGHWGELILENLLERSGLRAGIDYQREMSFTTEEGRRRPDVVLFLPQDKHLVIDAKVSLNAYTRYVNADSDEARRQALQEHVQAMRARLQELSDRHYFQLPGLSSPEVVFMFIPIESAFAEAMRADPGLLERSMDQRVLLATPSTLLASLHIVRQLWRFETQSVHSAQLAESAAKVYKKLCVFVETLQGLGQQLEKAQLAYHKAMNQLCQGRGNLIHQAQQFERLGVAIQESLPPELVAKAALELDWSTSQDQP